MVKRSAPFALILLVFSTPPILAYFRGGSTHDYSTWYQTGQKILRGEQLYPSDQEFPFMYPPLAALLLAPLSIFGEAPLIMVLVLVNSAALTASVLLSVYLVTGRMFRQPLLLYLLPPLCTVAYIWSTFFLGQPNLLLLALMLGAFTCLRHRQEWGAGALVALAAAIKAFPVLALGYFIYRRHWKALAAMLLSLGLFFVAIPFALCGSQQGAKDLAAWTRGMVLNYNQHAIGQRTNRAYSWKNPSLIGLANRLLRHKGANGENKARDFYVNFLNLDFWTTNLVIGAVGLLLCLAYVAMMPSYRLRNFFVWLLYPFTVLAHLWLVAPKPSREAGLLRASFVVILVLLILSAFFHWSFTRPLADAYGNVFVASLLLFGTLAWQLAKYKRVVRHAATA